MDIDDVNAVAVLGAGTMGHGIAEVAALAGFDVALRDVEEEFVQSGYERIEWSLDKLAEKDRLTDEEAAAALDRVTPLVDLEAAVGDADVVIEAVPERMEVKRDVYADLSAHAPDRTIFASNTSSLSITALAAETDRPERFCGMHFFNPPVRMDLVEVVAGDETNEETLELIEDLADAMGKTPIRVEKDSPGFVVNRVLVPLINEAAWMVHEGEATVAEVDSTTKYRMGLPMGLFELTDQVGLDVGAAVLEHMHDELGDAFEPCPLLEDRVEAGDLGRKTGAGVYDYEDGEGAQIPPDEGREDVERRLVAVMANNVAGLVGGGVADPDAIDRALKLGAGFPDGPVRMADEAALADLVAVLDERREATGAARYEVEPTLRELAESGEGFRGADAGADAGTAADGTDEGWDYEALTVEREDGVGTITLDRPHRLNAITMELVDEFEDALDRLVEDDRTRAVLLTAAGDRAFSVGADAQSTAGAIGSTVELTELSKRGQEVFGRMEECPLPVVAAVDGFCLGGGMEVVTCADLRVASRRSEFGQTEFDLGLMPGWGATQRLQRIVGAGRAKEIIFTADRYDAETMYEYGFVNEVVDADEIEAVARDLARDLAAGPPIPTRLTKRAMLRGWDDLDAGLEIESQSFGHLAATDDLMEGISAFMGDREPEFEGE